jgi:uncharacterized protein (DUF2141 family)
MRPALRLATVVTAATIAAAPLALSQSWLGGSLGPPGMLVMVMSGLRNDVGTVRVGLYDNPSRWPRANQNSRSCDAPIHGRRATCEIPNVPAGAYAIAIHHDENDNRHFDQGPLGWPLEGYGFSNNVHPRLLGPPTWDSARINYRGGAPMTVAMTMQY